jgi:tRNA dimethylallyltransferase
MKNCIAYLQEQLRILDPDYFEEITAKTQTLQNPQRMMRFTEVCIGSKTLLFFPQPEKKTRNFTPILIGLEAERSVMYDRINALTS